MLVWSKKKKFILWFLYLFNICEMFGFFINIFFKLFFAIFWGHQESLWLEPNQLIQKVKFQIQMGWIDYFPHLSFKWSPTSYLIIFFFFTCIMEPRKLKKKKKKLWAFWFIALWLLAVVMMTPTDSLDLIPGTVPRCTLHLKERARWWREWRAGDWWPVARVVMPPVWHGRRSADISAPLRHRPAWSDWSPRASEPASERTGRLRNGCEGKAQNRGGGRNKNKNETQTKLTNHKSLRVGCFTTGGAGGIHWPRQSQPTGVPPSHATNTTSASGWLFAHRKESCTSGWFPASRSQQLQLQMFCISGVKLETSMRCVVLVLRVKKLEYPSIFCTCFLLHSG